MPKRLTTSRKRLSPIRDAEAQHIPRLPHRRRYSAGQRLGKTKMRHRPNCRLAVPTVGARTNKRIAATLVLDAAMYSVMRSVS